MDYFQWWNESQKELADEAKKFTDETLIPYAERCAWKKQFPWKSVQWMAEKGWFGAQIPSNYGGHSETWGVTGACILMEETYRAGTIAVPLNTSMIGGIHQIIHDGTEEQKKKWLPKIARGELLGAIVMTEPHAGSDIANIETTAVRQGDFYVVNGKKRYQMAAGAADLYMTYVRTSDNPDDIAKYRHLTALVAEKGTPGLSVEKINDLVGLDGMYNGNLNFSNVKIPVENRIGEESAGWSVMMSGLNVERIVNSAGPLGQIRECIRYTMQHLQRRVQFGRLTGDITTNQFKVADMVWKLQLGRLLTYYAAYCADLGKETALEAAIAKKFNTDSALQVSIDAIQCMGGNGVSKYYPVERMMRDAKLMQIAGGSNEVLMLLIYRQGIRNMMGDLKVPPRVMDEELKVPMPLGEAPQKVGTNEATEDDILKLLAENYRLNPGLHMSMEDFRQFIDVDDETLNEYLSNLEKKGWGSLYKDRRGRIRLARATYEGLDKANQLGYYAYIPSWVDKNDMF
jgi:hypothetical protein